ncbi:hypothetical protein B296_00045535 [Ensete ventricosum]|uniref:Uncharacterized protein n=1 Tax=Ensete ventricosum TaxID=4639 RepID=A0A426Z731_ENSVE|nr:hypothetical protein B296_00045535 [Ensete ventricosum]
MAGGSAIHSLPPPMTHRFHAVPSLPLAGCFDLGSFSPYLEHTPSTFTPTPRLLPSLPLPDNAALGTFLTLASPSLPVSSARPFGSVPTKKDASFGGAVGPWIRWETSRPERLSTVAKSKTRRSFGVL